MKVKNFSNIPIEFLIGSCITLSDEDEGRYIKDVCVDLERHSIILGETLNEPIKNFFI